MLLTKFLKCKKWNTLQMLNVIFKKISNMNINNYYHLDKESLSTSFLPEKKCDPITEFKKANKTAKLSMIFRTNKERQFLWTELVKRGIWPAPNTIFPTASEELQDLENFNIVDHLRKKSLDNWMPEGNHQHEILTNLEKICWFIYNAEEIELKNTFKIPSNNLDVLNNFELYYCLKLIELWRKKYADTYYAKEKLDFLDKIDGIFCSRINMMPPIIMLLINYSYIRLHYENSKFFKKNMLQLEQQLMDMNYYNFIRFVFLVRSKSVISDLSNVEQYSIKYSKVMYINDVALVASALYKNRYVVNTELATILCYKLKENISTIESIFISTIIKVLKMNNSVGMKTEHLKLVIFLRDWVSMLHPTVLTHIAHLQSRSRIRDDAFLAGIIQRYKNEIENFRIKDVERITLALSELNYKPQMYSFFSLAVNELLKTEREKEISSFPLSFLYLTQFLLQANFFDIRILNLIMSPRFAYALPTHKLHYEYYVIEKCLELDHPDYKYTKLCSYFLDMFKTNVINAIGKSNRTSQQYHFMYDVTDHLQKCLESDLLTHHDLILPHLFLEDIILCYNPKYKCFVSPQTKLSKIPCGDIKFAPKDGNLWTAVVCSIHPLTLIKDNNTEITVPGKLISHVRHLKAAGYNTVVVHLHKWTLLDKLRLATNILKRSMV